MSTILAALRSNTTVVVMTALALHVPLGVSAAVAVPVWIR